MLMKQRGITLIEMMIAILIGLIVAATAITIYVYSVKSQTENINLIRLNQDVRGIMDLVVRDVRRAGFVTSSPESNFACLKNNPFGTISLLESDTSTTGDSCLLFSYNANDNQLCSVESNEHFGFRNDDGVLQMKSSGGNETDCSSGNWEAINDEEINITSVFSLDQKELDITEMFADDDARCDPGEECNVCDSGNQCLTIRTVDIEITGELDDGTEQTITEQIRIRNDLFELSH